MASLPDPRESRAVLIGTASYRTLPQLPSVAANVERLATLLMAPDLWGLPREHCRVLLNSESPIEVLDGVHEAAIGARDTLVVYYAGHGLRDPDNDELYLALPRSSRDRLFTAIRYDDLRREIVQVASAAVSKVVMLDCCYSGAAMQGGMDGAGQSADIADRARIEGTYLMTASASTVAALAPEGEEFTAFTGEVLDVWERGIPDGPDLLNMERLYWHVRGELESKRRPVPQQRAGNSGGLIALVRNRRGTWQDSAAPSPRHLPFVPAGLETLTRRSPQDIALHLDGLRAQDRDAEAQQVLAAIAMHRPDQEVAGLLAYLRDARRHEDVVQVIEAAAVGSIENVTAPIVALREVDQPDDIEDLLTAAARGPVGEIAALSRALRGQGFTDAVRRLLDAAIAQRPAVDAVISLAGALWSADLGPESERMLETGMTDLPAAEILTVAETLRASGRAELAAGMYVRARDAIVQLPDEEVASALRIMHDIEPSRAAGQTLEAVLGTRQRPGDFVSLATALWAAELEGDVEHLLSHAAARLSDEDLMEIASELRAMDRADSAFQLYRMAAALRPGRSTVKFADALRASNRPVDGNSLLASSASSNSDRVVEVLTELHRLERHADFDRVLRALADQPLQQITSVLVETRDEAYGAAVEQQVTNSVVGRLSPAETVEFATQLLAADLRSPAVLAVLGLVRDPNGGAAAFVDAVPRLGNAAVVFLDAVAELPTEFAVAVAKALSESGERQAAARIVEHLSEARPFRELVDDLDQHGWPQGMEICFAEKGAIPLQQLVHDYAMLRSAGQDEQALVLLDAVSMFGVAKEIPQLIDTMLDRFGPDLAERVIQTVASSRTPGDIATIIGVADLSGFSRRRRCNKIIDAAATRPDVRDVEMALRRGLLNQQADRITRVAARRSNRS